MRLRYEHLLAVVVVLLAVAFLGLFTSGVRAQREGCERVDADRVLLIAQSRAAKIANLTVANDRRQRAAIRSARRREAEADYRAEDGVRSRLVNCAHAYPYLPIP